MTDQPLLCRAEFVAGSYQELQADLIAARGRATWGRISNRGRTICDVDVGELGSDAEIRLTSVDLAPGGPLRISVTP
jgi:hypothetical protein